MKIGITLSHYAYTPEAYAYKDFLESKGHEIELEYRLDPNNDINIYFMGLIPFWKKKLGKALTIHEYHSASTPPHAHLKNRLKNLVNQKPQGRIFLNQEVRDSFKFKDGVRYIYRDMGVEHSLFQHPNPSPLYDIIYCGSISGRKNLVEVIRNLSRSYKILVVGSISEADRELLNSPNIHLYGKANRLELPDLYKNAHYGLNYTPDIYPYNVQTSTKVLEYLASGLKIISNKYYWIDNFSRAYDFSPAWIDDLNTQLDLSSHITNIPDIKDLVWDKILSKSNFEGFLQEILNDS